MKSEKIREEVHSTRIVYKHPDGFEWWVVVYDDEIERAETRDDFCYPNCHSTICAGSRLYRLVDGDLVFCRELLSSYDVYKHLSAMCEKLFSLDARVLQFGDESFVILPKRTPMLLGCNFVIQVLEKLEAIDEYGHLTGHIIEDSETLTDISENYQDEFFGINRLINDI